MATNALSYMRNVVNSAGYAFVENFKTMNPVVSDLFKESKALTTSLYDSIVDFKAKAVGVEDGGIRAQITEGSKELWNNLKSDLSTGKWYNVERAKKAESEALAAMGLDFDFLDDDFGDFDSGFDDIQEQELSEEASIQEKATKATVQAMDVIGSKTANAIATATVSSANYIVESNKCNTKALYMSTNEGFGKVNTGIAALNANISTLVSFTEPVTKHMQNSSVFFAKSQEFQDKALELLTRIAENTTQKVAKTQETKYDTVTLDSLLSANGAISGSSYVDFVRNNIKESISTYTSLFDIMGGVGGMSKNITYNPLGFLLKTAIGSLFNTKSSKGNTIKEASGSLNDALSGLMAGLFAKMEDKYKGNEFFDMISSLIIPKSGLKTTMDPSKYEKGPVAWDGIARKALIEVIPTQLAKIISLLSGKEERRFDYDKGTWRTATEIANLKAERNSMAAANAGGELLAEVKRSISLSDMDDRHKSRYNEELDDFLQTLVFKDDTEFLHILDRGFDISKYKDVISETTFKDFQKRAREILKHKRSLLTPMAKDFAYARAQYGRDSRYNDSLEMQLYNGSMIDTKQQSLEEQTMMLRFENWKRDNQGDPIYGNYTFARWKRDPRIQKGLLMGANSRKHPNLAPGSAIRDRMDEYGKTDLFYLNGIYSFTGYIAKNLKYLIPNGVLPGRRVKLEEPPVVQLSNTKGERITSSTVEIATNNEPTEDNTDNKRNESYEEALKNQDIETIIGNNVGRDEYPYIIDPELKKYIRDRDSNRARYYDEEKEKKIRDAKKIYDRFHGSDDEGGIASGIIKKILGNREFKPVGNMKATAGVTADEIANVADAVADKINKFIYGDDASDNISLLSTVGKGLGDIFNTITLHVSDYLPQFVKDIFKNITDSDEFKDFKKSVFGNIRSTFGWIFNGLGDFLGDLTNNGDTGEGASGSGLVDTINDKYENIGFAGGASQSNKRKRKVKNRQRIANNKAKNKQKQKKDATDTKSNIDIDDSTVSDNIDEEDINEENYFVSDTRFILHTAGKVANIVSSHLLDDINTLFGGKYKPEEERKKIQENLSNMTKDAIGNKGAIGAGALLGTGVSLISGVFLGPIAGAAIGGAIGFATKSKTAQDILFGKDIDEEGNKKEREGGVFNKKITDFVYKNLPSTVKGSAIGLMGGALLGSPILGAIVGSSIGYVRSSETAKRFLFGEFADPEDHSKGRIGGLLGAETQKKLKKAFPRMAEGAALAMAISPFGNSIVNVLVGSVLGFATTTETFKNWFFGTPDENGSRKMGEGGFSKKINEQLFKPIVDIFSILSAQIKEGFTDIFHTIKKKMRRFLYNHLVTPIINMVKASSIGQSITNSITKVFDTVTHPVQAIRNRMQKRSLEKGRTIGGDLTSEERQEKRRELSKNGTYDYSSLGAAMDALLISQKDNAKFSDILTNAIDYEKAQDEDILKGKKDIKNILKKYNSEDPNVTSTLEYVRKQISSGQINGNQLEELLKQAKNRNIDYGSVAGLPYYYGQISAEEIEKNLDKDRLDSISRNAVDLSSILSEEDLNSLKKLADAQSRAVSGDYRGNNYRGKAATDLVYAINDAIREGKLDKEYGDILLNSEGTFINDKFFNDKNLMHLKNQLDVNTRRSKITQEETPEEREEKIKTSIDRLRELAEERSTQTKEIIEVVKEQRDTLKNISEAANDLVDSVHGNKKDTSNPLLGGSDEDEDSDKSGGFSGLLGLAAGASRKEGSRRDKETPPVLYDIRDTVRKIYNFMKKGDMSPSDNGNNKPLGGDDNEGFSLLDNINTGDNGIDISGLDPKKMKPSEVTKTAEKEINKAISKFDANNKKDDNDLEDDEIKDEDSDSGLFGTISSLVDTVSSLAGGASSGLGNKLISAKNKVQSIFLNSIANIPNISSGVTKLTNIVSSMYDKMFNSNGTPTSGLFSFIKKYLPLILGSSAIGYIQDHDVINDSIDVKGKDGQSVTINKGNENDQYVFIPDDSPSTHIFYDKHNAVFNDLSEADKKVLDSTGLYNRLFGKGFINWTRTTDDGKEQTGRLYNFKRYNGTYSAYYDNGEYNNIEKIYIGAGASGIKNSDSAGTVFGKSASEVASNYLSNKKDDLLYSTIQQTATQGASSTNLTKLLDIIKRKVGPKLGKILKKFKRIFGDNIDDIVNDFTDEMCNKVAAAAQQFSSTKLASMANKVVSVLSAGWFDFGVSAYRSIKAYGDASTIIGVVDDASTPEKCLAALLTFFTNITSGLANCISPETLIDIFIWVAKKYNIDFSKIGLDSLENWSEELDERRTYANNVVDLYNKRNSTDLSIEDYNKKGLVYDQETDSFYTGKSRSSFLTRAEDYAGSKIVDLWNGTGDGRKGYYIPSENNTYKPKSGGYYIPSEEGGSASGLPSIGGIKNNPISSYNSTISNTFGIDSIDDSILNDIVDITGKMQGDALNGDIKSIWGYEIKLDSSKGIAPSMISTMFDFTKTVYSMLALMTGMLIPIQSTVLGINSGLNYITGGGQTGGSLTTVKTSAGSNTLSSSANSAAKSKATSFASNVSNVFNRIKTGVGKLFGKGGAGSGLRTSGNYITEQDLSGFSGGYSGLFPMYGLGGGASTDNGDRKKVIWDFLREKVGLSEAGAAGIMGCWESESTNDPTVVEGNYIGGYPGYESVFSNPPESFHNYAVNFLFPAYARSGININKPAYLYDGTHYAPGLGLAQWTGPRTKNLIDYTSSRNEDWRSLKGQLDFFINGGGEFLSRSGLQSELQNATDVSAATNIFYKRFESGGSDCPSGNPRYTNAQNIYNKYSGTAVTTDLSQYADALSGTTTTSSSGDSSSDSSNDNSSTSTTEEVQEEDKTLVGKIKRAFYDAFTILLGGQATSNTSSSSSSSGTSSTSSDSSTGGTVASNNEFAGTAIFKGKNPYEIMQDWKGKLTYEMTGKNPHSGVSDCSSTVRQAIIDAGGPDVGGWTNPQSQNTTTLSIIKRDTNGIKPGDVDIKPNDLLFYQCNYSSGDTSTYPYGIGHVTMAEPDGKMIEQTRAYGGKGTYENPLKYDRLVQVSRLKDIGNGVYSETSGSTTGGSSVGKKYNVTEKELEHLANIGLREQGNTQGEKAEISQICNRTDYANRNGQKYSSPASYVDNSGWYGNPDYTDYISSRGANRNEAINIAKDIVLNGNRTLPLYVDEHDCFSDITSISTGGAINNKSSYVKDKTVIKNRYGSTYTFDSFSSDLSMSDPFGYTAEMKRWVDSGGASGSGLYGVGGGASGFVSQLDSKYNKIGVGSKSFAKNGCGPASAVMALGSLGKKSSVGTAAKIANKYQTSGGTDAAYFRDMFRRNGVGSSYVTGNNVKSAVASGKPVVLMGQDKSNTSKSRSPFGPNNHYVVAKGMDKNGNINIADPESNGVHKYSSKILNNVKVGVAASGSGIEDQSMYGEGAGASEIAQKAANWAAKVAADSTHGYKAQGSAANAEKDFYGSKSMWGNPDYSCTTLVASAYRSQGVDINPKLLASDPDSSPSSAANRFKQAGFKELKFTGKNLLESGDVLLTPSHAVIYWVPNGMTPENGLYVEAKGNTDGKPGESANNEINYGKHKYSPTKRWAHILRYDGTASGQSLDSNGSSSSTQSSQPATVTSTDGTSIDASSLNLDYGGNDTTHSFADQVWSYLKNLKLPDAGAAGIMANIYHESGKDFAPQRVEYSLYGYGGGNNYLKKYNLESKYKDEFGVDTSSPTTMDKTYTESVDKGTMPLDWFMHPMGSGTQAGYGISQFTFDKYKEQLKSKADSKSTSVGNLAVQLDVLMDQLRSSGVLDAASSESADAADIAKKMLLDYEKPSNAESQVGTRSDSAAMLLNQYAGKGVISLPVYGTAGSVASNGVGGTGDSPSGSGDSSSDENQTLLSKILQAVSDAFNILLGGEEQSSNSGTSADGSSSNGSFTSNGRDNLLKIAAQEVGTTEDPAGSNNVKYNTWLYGQPVSGDKVPWCAAFVSWLFNEAYGGDAAKAKEAMRGDKTAAVATLRGYGAAANALTNEPEPGDIIIYGANGSRHTGIVESVDKSDKSWIGIEGNTSGGNQSNGGAVARKEKRYYDGANKYSDLNTFVRPNWVDAVVQESTSSDGTTETGTGPASTGAPLMGTSGNSLVGEFDTTKGNGIDGKSPSSMSINGTRFNIYNQGGWGGTYNSQSYGPSSSGTMASKGCGPTALATILSKWYGNSYNPTQVADDLETTSASYKQKYGKGYQNSNVVNMKHLVESKGFNANTHFGINRKTPEQVTTTKNEIKNALSLGRPITYFVTQNSGTDDYKNFTGGQHFISLLGYDTKSDKIYVGNPNDKYNGWYSADVVARAGGLMDKNMQGWIDIGKSTSVTSTAAQAADRTRSTSSNTAPSSSAGKINEKTNKNDKTNSAVDNVYIPTAGQNLTFRDATAAYSGSGSGLFDYNYGSSKAANDLLLDDSGLFSGGATDTELKTDIKKVKRNINIESKPVNVTNNNRIVVNKSNTPTTTTNTNNYGISKEMAAMLKVIIELVEKLVDNTESVKNIYKIISASAKGTDSKDIKNIVDRLGEGASGTAGDKYTDPFSKSYKPRKTNTEASISALSELKDICDNILLG